MEWITLSIRLLDGTDLAIAVSDKGTARIMKLDSIPVSLDNIKWGTDVDVVLLEDRLYVGTDIKKAQEKAVLFPRVVFKEQEAAPEDKPRRIRVKRNTGTWRPRRNAT